MVYFYPYGFNLPQVTQHLNNYINMITSEGLNSGLNPAAEPHVFNNNREINKTTMKPVSRSEEWKIARGTARAHQKEIEKVKNVNMHDMLRDEAEDEEFFATMHEEDVTSDAETLKDDDDDEKEHYESEKSSIIGFNALTDDEEEDHWAEWDAEDDLDAVCNESEEDKDIENDVKLKKKLLDSNKVDIEKKDVANVTNILNEKSKSTTVCDNNSSKQQKDHEKDAHDKELFDNTIALKNNFKLLNDCVVNDHKEFVDETFKKIVELTKTMMIVWINSKICVVNGLNAATKHAGM